ncbi:hypothetical protein [Asticcacaulis solisilvae]|uniref:hypothetical protein n=1 Tax=Asticcacaulis solisilvae TaxID=1217274 RepID=UPI003FD84A08
MKRICTLLALALILAAPASQAAARPVAAEAVMGVKLGAIINAALDADQDHWRRRDGDDRKDNRDDRDDGRWNNGGRDRGGEDRRDNRINRAIAIASSRGHVLDAGQQSGSIFWVRVATERGRVDLLVDTDSGRIVGER